MRAPHCLLALVLALASASIHAADCDHPSGDTLAQIRDRSSVRIGTTGDYAPFSYREDGERTGIDIALGERLASALGVEPEWIETSWPTLAADLEAGKFDVAMSGISITAERAALGCFSSGYFVTGKTVLAHCRRAETFTGLDAIDRPGVRVIVNPGGTNERFVRANIEHADVTLHPDNIGIFDALARGEADLMITDAIEARLQAEARPALCAPLGDDYLEPVTKAWLTVPDAAWQAWLDAWLETLRGSGELDAVIGAYVP